MLPYEKKPSELPCPIRTAVLFMAIVVLTGCASLNQFVQKPAATFHSVDITKADLVQSTAVFNFDVYNPNAFGIRARRITYDLKLNGMNFVKGQLDQGIELPAGATNQLQVPITLPYLDFYKSMAQLWRTKSADYALTGGFDVGPFTIPFQAHGTFNLPKMPRVSLETVKIQSFSPLGARLSCQLRLDNPNAFDLLFNRLDYQLDLGGLPFAKASALPQSPIGRNSSSVIDLAFNVSFSQLGRSAYQLLRGSKAAYTLNGGLVFDRPDHGEQKIPINLSGKVPFIR